MKNSNNPFTILQKLTFGSTQLVNAAGVTSRQLRYWETQGYIDSLPEMAGNARQYTVSTALRVMAIKQGLAQGLKLADAVTNAQTVIDQSNYLGQLINETYVGYQRIDNDHVALHFGALKDQPDQQLTGVITPTSSYFKLRNEAK